MKSRVILLLFLILAGTSKGQWTQQTSNTTSKLNDVHFLNDSIGFAVGDNGVFLKTTDRGQNWELSVIEATDDLTSVFAVDQNLIYAGGEQLYWSTDGGQNWYPVPFQVDIHEIKFFSPDIGYTSTGYFDFCDYNFFQYKMDYRRSTNGGSIWQDFPQILTEYVKSEIDIVTPDTGYLVGHLNGWDYAECMSYGYSRILKTTDGGISWQEVLMPIGYSGTNIDASFLNGWEGYLLNSENGIHLYKINNGGSDFIMIHEINDNSIRSLAFATLSDGFYTSAGKIMKTSSGGISWEQDYSSPDTISKIVITENFEGYAIGNSGLILHKKINPSNTPQAMLNIDQNRLDYPFTNISDSSFLSMNLIAAGTADIGLNLSAPPGFLIKLEGSGEFVNEITGLVIPCQHDTNLVIAFSPTLSQYYRDTLVISSDASFNPLIKLPVSGKGAYCLSGTISQDTTFCADSIWVRNNVTVAPGSTLTLCPGTVVVISNLTDDYQDFIIEGSLIAAGTETDSIRFVTDTESEKWDGIISDGEDPSDSIKMQYCQVENTDNSNNLGDNGGAITVYGSKPVSILNSTFKNCHSYNSGGAIYSGGSNCKIESCFIFNCTAHQGGGIYITGTGQTLIKDCDLIDCSASLNGGGIYISDYADAKLQNCTIKLCEAGKSGGGIAINSAANIEIVGSHFTANKANEGDGGGIYLNAVTGGVIANSEISGNTANDLSGGGIYMLSSSLTIKDNEFLRNSASLGGGCYLENSATNFTGNTVMYNFGSLGISRGGGVYINSNLENQPVNIIQNVFYQNKSNGNQTGGAAIYIYHAKANIFFNDILNNVIENGSFMGGGIFCNTGEQDSVKISGNIIYSNTPDQILLASYTAPTLVEYNDIKGGWFLPGTGNIASNPDFYSEPAEIPDSIANYYFVPSQNSPCINAGPVDTAGLMIPTTDFAGNPRFISDRIDIGMYENNFLFQSSDTIMCPGQDLTFSVNPIIPGTYTYSWSHDHELIPGIDTNVLNITGTALADFGYYQCIVQSENQAIRSRYINLELPSDYDMHAILQPQSAIVPEGSDITLKFRVLPASSTILYQWYYNSQPIDGETRNELALNNFYSALQGTYECRAENPCYFIFSDEAVLTMTSSGIEDQEGMEAGGHGGVVVRPNPAGGQLTVGGWWSAVGGRQSAVVSRQSSVRLGIFDLFGREVLSFRDISSFPFTFDISDLPDGMYVVRMYSDDGFSGTAKFLKVSR